MPDYKMLGLTRDCMIETLKMVGTNVNAIASRWAGSLGPVDKQILDGLVEDIDIRISSTIDVLKEDLEEL